MAGTAALEPAAPAAALAAAAAAAHTMIEDVASSGESTYASWRMLPVPLDADAPPGPPHDAGAPKGSAVAADAASAATVFELPNALRCAYVVREETGPPSDIVHIAVSIAAGQLDDPKDVQGLARLMEHLLCAGSTHFPHPHALAKRCSACAGAFAAKTGNDDVAFSCDVPVASVPDVLEILGDMLLQPNLLADALDSAIDSLDADRVWRTTHDESCMWQLQRDLAHPDHPLCGFGTGSADTLRAVPRVVLEQRIAEWRARYLVGPEVACCVAVSARDVLSLAECEALCLETLSGVGLDQDNPARTPHAAAAKQPRPAVTAPCFPKHTLGSWVDVKSTWEGNETLQLVFPLEGLGRAHYPSLAANFVSHLLSCRDAGSMLEELVARGLARSGTFGVEHAGASWSLLTATFPLTPAGAARPLEVAHLFFQGMAAVRASIVEHGARALWDGMQSVVDLHLTIIGGPAALLNAAQIAGRMHYIQQPGHLLAADHAFLEFSPTEIDAVLAAFAPQNMLAFHASAGFDPHDLPLRSRWSYNTPHGIRHIPDATLARWARCGKGTLATCRPVQRRWLAGCREWLAARRAHWRGGGGAAAHSPNVFASLPRISIGVPLFRGRRRRMLRSRGDGGGSSSGSGGGGGGGSSPERIGGGGRSAGAFHSVVCPTASGEGLLRYVVTVPEARGAAQMSAVLHMLPELLAQELKNFINDAVWCRAAFVVRIHQESQCRLEILVHSAEPVLARIAVDALAALLHVLTCWVQDPTGALRPDRVKEAQSHCATNIIMRLSDPDVPFVHTRLQANSLLTMESPHTAEALVEGLWALTTEEIVAALPSTLLSPARASVSVYGSTREAVACDDITAYLEGTLYPALEALAEELGDPAHPAPDRRVWAPDAHPQRLLPPLVAGADGGPPHYLTIEQSTPAEYREGKPACAVYELCFPMCSGWTAVEVCAATSVLASLLHLGLTDVAEDAGIEEVGCQYFVLDSCAVCCLHATSPATHAFDLLHFLRFYANNLAPPFDAAAIGAARQRALAQRAAAAAEGVEMEGEDVDQAVVWGRLYALRVRDGLRGLARTSTRAVDAHIETADTAALNDALVALLEAVAYTLACVATTDPLEPHYAASAPPSAGSGGSSDPADAAHGLLRVDVALVGMPTWPNADGAPLEFYKIENPSQFVGRTAVC